MRTLPIRPVFAGVPAGGKRRNDEAKQRILVIDDEIDVGEFVSAAAQGMGFECTATTDAAAFLEALTPDTTLILLDLMMPEMDGIELLRLLGEQKCKAGIVLMSGVGKRVLETAGQLAQVLGLSIVGHLQKPFRLAELEEVLARHAEPATLPIVQEGAQFITHNEELRSAVERNEFVTSLSAADRYCHRPRDWRGRLWSDGSILNEG
jgi:CheY-like chemotaxis protein